MILRHAGEIYKRTVDTIRGRGFSEVDIRAARHEAGRMSYQEAAGVVEQESAAQRGEV